MPAIIEKRIPGTDEALPALGMGCWGIGGRTEGNTSYGETDDATSLRTLRTALDAGVRFFDVAPPYGNGHAETLLGQTIRGRRQDAFVATKVGRPRFDRPMDCGPETFQHSLEQSLHRLGLDSVDLVQFHDPSPEMVADGSAIEALMTLKERGLARFTGVSCKAPEHGLDLVGRGIDFLQVNFNLMDQRAAACGLLDAAEGKVAIIARTPLCFGFLSGTIPDDPRFGEGDHRNNWPPAQIARWIEGAREFSDRLAARGGLPLLDLALRYCLSFQAVTAVLPGMMHPEEVTANAEAVSAGPLDPSIVSEITTFYQSTEFFLPR
ncbi:MAG: aldo/keto reductase [Alphaproteobacteria bacterium]|nr:aldo/keto reductase [Alphaproteobacteria bacterium]